MWKCHRSTDNRYSGDNRLIGSESSDSELPAKVTLQEKVANIGGTPHMRGNTEGRCLS